jgi:hypothetical protein
MSQARQTNLPVTDEWLAELSPERYRPMGRLLGESDLRFLRAQRGFHPEMEKRLRAQRVRVFRGYLRVFDADIRRLCSGLNPGMSGRMRWQVKFAFRMWVVKSRLPLYQYGIAEVDVAPLVTLFEALRVELTTQTFRARPVPA